MSALKIRLIVLISSFSVLLSAQTDSLSVEFRSMEISIIKLFKNQRAASSNKQREQINDSIRYQFRQFLELSKSFDYRLDSLKMAGIIYAPDKTFRIINWNVQNETGTHHHYGFIQLSKPKGDKKYFELTDKSEEIRSPEGAVLSAGKWYGGLYYKMLKNKVDNRIYYTLLALKYNDLFVTKKFIDVLYFDEYGNPVFGAPIFQVGPKQTKIRIVFEYSALVSMSLKYDEQRKQIIFDHLSPSESKYNGISQYYGPDLSFDGLVFENKHWNYISNIDIRRPDYMKPKIIKAKR